MAKRSSSVPTPDGYRPDLSRGADLTPDNEVRDTPSEVDAAFRAQRGIAIAYFLVFLVLVAAFPVLTITLPWWSGARVFGELSPGFVAAAGGLYLAFAVMGIAAARLSASVESRMLGGQQELDDDAARAARSAEDPR
ncbi:hypothetical protein [Nesterenkonia sp. CF4.4]|uniref:hypothetical protein n=1 Tax=Nesterenkonia sp. CF4.4 TaxID=3373079 RepID=UPI003EE5D180